MGVLGVTKLATLASTMGKKGKGKKGKKKAADPIPGEVSCPGPGHPASPARCFHMKQR